MGFGNTATHLILFITVMSVATGFVIVAKTQIDGLSGSMQEKQTILSKRLETELIIEVIRFDNSSNTTSVYVKNIGNTMLDISKVDIFFDNLIVPRNAGNRSIAVLTDTDMKNLGVWDKGEIALITTNIDLEKSKTHTVTVTTQYGIKDESSFSI